jgi:hypothetical protein
MGGLFNKNVGLVKENLPNAGVSNYNGEVALITKYDILDENGLAIGYLQSFSPSDNRPATKIRHISSADSGRVLEHAPGFSDTKISVTGFALYNRQEDGSIVQRLGGGVTRRAMKMLEEQKVPFKILERQVDPETNTTLDATEHLDCWLTSHSAPRNMTNVTISETAEISTAGNTRPLNFTQI